MEKNYQSGEFEFKGWTLNGFLMLLVNLLMYAGAVYIFVIGIMKENNNEPFAFSAPGGIAYAGETDGCYRCKEAVLKNIDKNIVPHHSFKVGFGRPKTILSQA